jgi:hypothetical protein
MFTAALRLIVSAWSRLTEQPRLVPVPVKRQQSAPKDSESKRPTAYSLPPTQFRGLTIIEMMVSLASVMLLMMAYVTLFADVGGRIGEARSMIELTNRMRSASNRLRMDLEAHTCDMLPWQRPEAGGGYFEIIEGPTHDLPSPIPTSDNTATLWDETHPLLGDTDDVLMFTVRSKEGPFTGKYWRDTNGNGTVDTGELQTVQSEVAEVVWFLRPTLKADGSTPVDPLTYTLYRRVFLVMPTYQGSPTTFATTAQTNWPHLQSTFYDNNDISVHTDGTTIVANTLADLTKRECRYFHRSDPASVSATLGFPHRFDQDYKVPFGGLVSGGSYQVVSTNSRYGEDVVLTNVISFDVQVWDPQAPVEVPSTANVALGPGDPGYVIGGSASSTGAFVDLNWGGTTTWASGGASNPFKTQGHTKSLLNATASTEATYDTWSYHYEHDGIDQNNNSVTDEGTDGFANHHQSGNPDVITNNSADPVSDTVDGPNERETSPPYPVPLRGIKIKIRCYEPDARQVHEVDVVESFVPQ